MFKYFKNVWSDYENYMNKVFLENYIFMLNLCLKLECFYFLCVDKFVRRNVVWYENGLVLLYIFVFILDLK